MRILCHDKPIIIVADCQYTKEKTLFMLKMPGVFFWIAECSYIEQNIHENAMLICLDPTIFC